jgi:ribosome modulation factor
MNDITMLLPHIKLRFNIEHPSIEECYMYGYECAIADVSEANNPYRIGTKEHDHWIDGWWAGTYGEEPLFTLNQEMEPMIADNANSANDHVYHESRDNFFIKLLEISGMIAVSALVGYQLIELVA